MNDVTVKAVMAGARIVMVFQSNEGLREFTFDDTEQRINVNDEELGNIKGSGKLSVAVHSTNSKENSSISDVLPIAPDTSFDAEVARVNNLSRAKLLEEFGSRLDDADQYKLNELRQKVVALLTNEDTVNRANNG